MLHLLPNGEDIEYMEPEALPSPDPSQWQTDRGAFGYFICTDWTFDDTEVQERFTDYPPLPERKPVYWEDMSDFSQHLHVKLGRVNKNNTKNWKSVPKLVADFKPRVSSKKKEKISLTFDSLYLFHS